VTTNVTIRVDEDLKKQAEELFSDFGMNMTTAYIMFLKQAVREQRIPFVPSRNIPNAETIAAIEEAGAMRSDPSTKRFSSVDELIEELNSEFIKKLVFAWDPDFTKATPDEAARIKAAEESGFVSEDEIDWDKIGR